MQELKQLLDDKLGWLVNTTGAKHVNVKLTLEQLLTLEKLMAIHGALDAPDTGLPKVEPRMLGQQEPRGTKRSPEEVARLLAERYGQTDELRGKFLRTCA